LEKLGLDEILEKVPGLNKAVRAGVSEAATEYLENPVQAFLGGMARDKSCRDIGSDVF
jgi:hypothetical protein